MDVQVDPAPPPRTFQCGKCPKTYRLQKRLDYHMKVHSPDDPHVCPLCNRGWAFAFQLTHHLRSHIGEKLFKCPADGCPKEFARQESLKAHMHKHSGGKSKPKANCATCGKTMISQRSLRLHIWKYHSAAPKHHLCATCGNVYQSGWDLTRHLQSHLPTDPQSCLVCGKSYRTGFLLKRHLQMHARVARESDLAHLRSQKLFQCPTCPKGFRSKGGLRSHSKIHVVEIVEKPEECQFCGLRFAMESDLAQHLRSHTGEKPFQCPICSKAFASKVGVRLHIKQHTGQKPAECGFCGLWFLCTSTLSQHFRSHTEETLTNVTRVGRNSDVPACPAT